MRIVISGVRDKRHALAAENSVLMIFTSYFDFCLKTMSLHRSTPFTLNLTTTKHSMLKEPQFSVLITYLLGKIGKCFCNQM